MPDQPGGSGGGTALSCGPLSGNERGTAETEREGHPSGRLFKQAGCRRAGSHRRNLRKRLF